MRYFFFTLLCVMPFIAAFATDLTLAEQGYVKEHPVIKAYGDAGNEPFFFTADGKATGFSVEYLELAAKKIGLTVQFVQDKKDADVIAYSKKSEDKKYLYAGPYFTDQHIFAGRDAADYIRDSTPMNGKTVALVKGSYGDSLVQKKYPTMKRMYVAGVLDGLKAVEFSKADLAFCGRAEAGYYISKNSIIGLVAALTPGGGDDIYFAVRPDAPELASILGKSLSDMTPEEIKPIHDKWIIKVASMGKRPADVKISTNSFKAGVLPAAVVVLVLMAAVAVAMRRRKRK